MKGLLKKNSGSWFRRRLRKILLEKYGPKALAFYTRGDPMVRGKLGRELRPNVVLSC